ncbi:MAG: hemolysin family protein [Sphingomonadaceae bacterium]|uniref:hemolysin family protein n=1 Tax=Thermaurantiacus sp. TaxID=2820283 RepID=UPI00298F1044|nr:hemolysin family protein [Thermaurantiacus sp.]MCS6985913.1 hemolysin family protein [Sphingomonadaceae bacterium]MDW8414871.1 hemolysin family protein [Thermaurantiacus sp.]
MPEPSSTAGSSGLWQALRSLLALRSHPPTLRESVEEAIEEHAEEPQAPEDLDADERTMLRNLLAASERRAGDIATPRGDIRALEADTPIADAVQVFRTSGHTRLPVYRGSLDQVVGMVHLKDLFAAITGEGPPPGLEPLVRPVLFVPPGRPILDLLADMRHARIHLAIVVDEFGGTDGLVTIEDIVEEIVGEIEDEHDETLPALVRPLADGSFEADARVPLDQLSHALGVELGDVEGAEEVDTLGGLVVLLAGRVPTPGDVLSHPSGWQFQVTAGDERRIGRLVLHPPAASPEGD